MTVTFQTEQEILKSISMRAKQLRLSQNLTQELLAKKSGVSLGSVKRFETYGEISLKSLIRISYALGCVDQCDALFQSLQEIQSLEEVKKRLKLRKRGRKNA